MRHIKTLGLVAMAALVAMGFVGASSAMAAEHEEIVLCKVQVLLCNELSNWASDEIVEEKHLVEIHLETLAANPPTLLTSIGNIECEHSLAIITLLNKLAKLIEAHVLALNFTGNCHLGATTCKVTVISLGGLSITPGKEKLTAHVLAIPLKEVETEVLVKCSFLVNCTYHATAATELEANSDAVGHLSLLSNAQPVKGKGICPETSLWDAEYHAVNLDEELRALLTFPWVT